MIKTIYIFFQRCYYYYYYYLIILSSKFKNNTILKNLLNVIYTYLVNMLNNYYIYLYLSTFYRFFHIFILKFRVSYQLITDQIIFPCLKYLHPKLWYEYQQENILHHIVIKSDNHYSSLCSYLLSKSVAIVFNRLQISRIIIIILKISPFIVGDIYCFW